MKNGLLSTGFALLLLACDGGSTSANATEDCRVSTDTTYSVVHDTLVESTYDTTWHGHLDEDGNIIEDSISVVTHSDTTFSDRYVQHLVNYVDSLCASGL